MCALTYWVCDVFSCGHGHCMAWHVVGQFMGIMRYDGQGFEHDITCLSSSQNDVDACLFDVLT